MQNESQKVPNISKFLDQMPLRARKEMTTPRDGLNRLNTYVAKLWQKNNGLVRSNFINVFFCQRKGPILKQLKKSRKKLDQ